MIKKILAAILKNSSSTSSSPKHKKINRPNTAQSQKTFFEVLKNKKTVPADLSKPFSDEQKGSPPIPSQGLHPASASTETAEPNSEENLKEQAEMQTYIIPSSNDNLALHSSSPFSNLTSTMSEPHLKKFSAEKAAEVDSQSNISPNPNQIPDARETGIEPQAPRITDRQLRALNNKHLLIMIRDLEKELAFEKKEKKNLLWVYKMVMDRSE